MRAAETTQRASDRQEPGTSLKARFQLGLEANSGILRQVSFIPIVTHQTHAHATLSANLVWV